MMHHAHVPMEEHYLLLADAFDMATKIDGLIPIELDGETKTQDEHWCGVQQRFVPHMQVWGEARTVKLKMRGTPKVADSYWRWWFWVEHQNAL